jgi:hypothetical protein
LSTRIWEPVLVGVEGVGVSGQGSGVSEKLAPAPAFLAGELGTVEKTAMVCHEANRAYCATIGDDTQKPWHEAEQWQRESAIKGVEFRIAHPEALPSAQHDAWAADKLADGWKYGPVKDPEKKEHPCLVEYGQLPEAQRRKDLLFALIVHAVMGDNDFSADELEEGVESGRAGKTMTVSEAAATLGNGVKEAADSEAGRVLAAARKKDAEEPERLDERVGSGDPGLKPGATGLQPLRGAGPALAGSEEAPAALESVANRASRERELAPVEGTEGTRLVAIDEKTSWNYLQRIAAEEGVSRKGVKNAPALLKAILAHREARADGAKEKEGAL